MGTETGLGESIGLVASEDPPRVELRLAGPDDERFVVTVDPTATVRGTERVQTE